MVRVSDVLPCLALNTMTFSLIKTEISRQKPIIPVSYTHLDVYKRQASLRTVMDSISFGLIMFKGFLFPDTPLPSTGMPSMTINFKFV